MAANSGNRIRVRIVVAGDRGTGKSSLIVSDVADNFPANVPPVLFGQDNRSAITDKTFHNS